MSGPRSNEEIAIAAHKVARTVSPVRVQWGFLPAENRLMLIERVAIFRARYDATGDVGALWVIDRALGNRTKVFLREVHKMLREDSVK